LEIHSPGTKKKNATKKMRVRPLKPAAVHAFREFVTNCDWSFIKSTNDVNDKVNAFLEFTQVSIDSFFPIKTVKLHEDDKPFITGRLKKLMAKRNKAHKSGNFELFKRLRNQIVAEVRSAKKNFYHNHVRPTFCTNPHFWWKNVNKIVGKKKQSITLFDPKRNTLWTRKKLRNI
jgi:hypothetical protein